VWAEASKVPLGTFQTNALLWSRNATNKKKRTSRTVCFFYPVLEGGANRTEKKRRLTSPNFTAGEKLVWEKAQVKRCTERPVAAASWRRTHLSTSSSGCFFWEIPVAYFRGKSLLTPSPLTTKTIGRLIPTRSSTRKKCCTALGIRKSTQLQSPGPTTCFYMRNRSGGDFQMRSSFTMEQHCYN